MEAAARRLLAEWDERIAKKKASERLNQGSERIESQARVPAHSWEKEGPGQSDKGVRTLDGQVPIADAGGCCAGWEIRCGQVVANRKCRPCEGIQGVTIACPLTETDTIAGGFTVPDLNGNASRREKE